MGHMQVSPETLACSLRLHCMPKLQALLAIISFFCVGGADKISARLHTLKWQAAAGGQEDEEEWSEK